MLRTSLVTVFVCAAGVIPAAAKDTSYVGSIHVVRGSGDGDNTVRGTVFLDENRNSVLDEGEPGVPGVAVSNGREVAITGGDGRYELPAYGDMNVFVTKPAEHAVPVDAMMVPQFNYIHKEAGSPPLRFGGIEPTGPLPEAINFPLIPAPEGSTFKTLAFGDTQAYSNRQIGYVRDTLGPVLATRDLSDVEFLIFEGDMMGDDLSLFPRFKRIIAQAGVPQYYVPGNHDLDWDATSDADSFDTFRREWGPEYYSFDVGDVHIVVLDNVRYPCNGIDDHPFCASDAPPNYNGIVTDRQLEWLRNDLAGVPQDKLILINTHVPLMSYIDSAGPKHQTDNLFALAEIIGGRPALSLAGHTHTTEQLLPGERFAGFQEYTGLATPPFPIIITGAVSGNWWMGDLNDQGVPRGTQRLGAPRGYFELAFDGTEVTDTFFAFGRDADEQLHVGFNTPRFRQWADTLFAFADNADTPGAEEPPVIRTDLGDTNMITTADLTAGTWAAVNVWNGSRDSTVTLRIGNGAPISATRTQAGEGETVERGAAYADPVAVADQSTLGRMAWRSREGGEETAGFEVFRGQLWAGNAGPPLAPMLARQSNHLWRADLPVDLPVGAHTLTVQTVDRHGRTYSKTVAFEVVDTVPMLNANKALFEE